LRSRRVICLWAVAALGIAVIASPSVSLANQASDQLNAGVQLFNEGEYGQARLLLLRVEVEDLSDAERAERNRLITEASIAQNQVGKAHREKAEADLLLSKGETGKATRLYESILSNRYASADMKEHAALNLKRIAGGLPSATQPTTQPTLVPKAPENPSPAQTDEASALGPSPARANASADSTPDINAANVPAHSAGAAVAEAEEFVGPIAPETLLAQSAEPTTEATGASQGNRPVEAAHEREGVSERGPGQTTEREVGPPANGGDLQPVQPTLPVVAQAGRTDEELDELSRAIPQQELAAEVVSENRAPAGPASQPVAEATPEARAQAAEEAKAARAALDKGELGAATEHYRKALQLVPGYPEAVEGLSEIEQFETIDENASLVDKIRQRKAIQWQKADTIYREADRDVRQAVTEHRYQDARKALEYARQTLEANRANAEPASLYEDLKREAESLARYVDDEERKYEEDQVKRAMEEVEQAQRRRQEEAEQAKQQ